MTFHSPTIRFQGQRSAFLLKLMLGVDRQRRSVGQRLGRGLPLRGSEDGLTLIEGLIAIVVIAITVIGITPPIFWATATRVQNQRAEQALKLAQGEIDRVRSIVERNEAQNFRLDKLPPVMVSLTPGLSDAEIVRASSGAYNSAPNAAKANTVISSKVCPNPDDGLAPSIGSQYVQVDVNGDCAPDFLMQTFRSPGLDERGERFDPTNTQGRSLTAFVMAVRVYSIVAKEKLDAGQGKVEPAQLKGTTGLGFQLDRPLAVLTSTIVRSTEGDNLNVYRKLCENSRAC